MEQTEETPALGTVFVISVSNGMDYEEYREWPVGYYTNEAKAKEFVKTIGEGLTKMYQDAYDAQWKRRDRTGEWCDLFETAAGKRYRGYMIAMV